MAHGGLINHGLGLINPDLGFRIRSFCVLKDLTLPNCFHGVEGIFSWVQGLWGKVFRSSSSLKGFGTWVSVQEGVEGFSDLVFGFRVQGMKAWGVGMCWVKGLGFWGWGLALNPKP